MQDDGAWGYIHVMNANGTGITQITFGSFQTDTAHSWQPIPLRTLGAA